MTSSDASPTTVEQIKDEIDSLTDEQADALRTATYLGMTVVDAQEYDKRRSRITSLFQELERLEAARISPTQPKIGNKAQSNVAAA